MKGKNQIKRIMILVFMLGLMALPGSNVSAASKNQRALAAYKKILSKGSYSYWKNYGGYKERETLKLKQFALVDVNKDGVKELIAGYPGPKLIFTYNGKKVVLVCDEYGSVTYNSKLKSLMFVGSSGYDMDYSYVKVTSKGKYKRTTLGAVPDEYDWWINGNYVSKKVWKKTNSKLYGKKKNHKKVRFYSNTSANRKKIGKLSYLK